MQLHYKINVSKTHSVNLASRWIFVLIAHAVQFSKPHNKSIVNSRHNLTKYNTFNFQNNNTIRINGEVDKAKKQAFSSEN